MNSLQHNSRLAEIPFALVNGFAPLQGGFFIVMKDLFDLQDVEVWKDIAGYEGLYKASTFGNILSLKKNVILKYSVAPNNYPLISLFKDKVYKRVRIHRIIALTFIPNPENKREVNHKNGIKTDNRLENLEWVTPCENQTHAVKTKLRVMSKGEDSPVSKLNNESVLEIRSKYKKYVFSCRKLGEEYGVHTQTISSIIQRRTWNHLPSTQPASTDEHSDYVMD